VEAAVTNPITTWPHDPIERDKTVAEVGEGAAWIQWKGTDVCMDVHCRCGAHGHIDTWFAYFYKCLACGQVFAVGATVRLYPLSPELVAKHGERAKVDEELAAGGEAE
jgi:hypothetical protein